MGSAPQAGRGRRRPRPRSWRHAEVRSTARRRGMRRHRTPRCGGGPCRPERERGRTAGARILNGMHRNTSFEGARLSTFRAGRAISRVFSAEMTTTTRRETARVVFVQAASATAKPRRRAASRAGITVELPTRIASTSLRRIADRSVRTENPAHSATVLRGMERPSLTFWRTSENVRS